MWGHVYQMFLYLKHFIYAQARRIRLIVHLEVFDILKAILGFPLNTLFLFSNRW